MISTVAQQILQTIEVITGVIQIATFVIVSRLAFRNLASRVEAGDMAAALYLAAVSICVGLLNAACMTT